MAVVPLIEAFLSQLLFFLVDRKMAWGFVFGVGLGLVVVSAAWNIQNWMRKNPSVTSFVCNEVTETIAGSY